MNSKKLKIFAKRVEFASNAIVGACLAGAGALLINDGHIVFENATLAMVIAVSAIVLYGIVTWYLMELEATGSEDETEGGDG
jgi:uncharacterized membrane protein YesL